jgi:hypothetical protein
MYTFDSILDTHLSSPVSNTEQVLFRELKRLEPDPQLQHVVLSHYRCRPFQLLDYLKSKGVTVTVDTQGLHESLRWNSGGLSSASQLPYSYGDVVDDSGSSDAEKGSLTCNIETGILRFNYAGTDYKVYQVSWVDGNRVTLYDFVFMHNYESEALPASDNDTLYQYSPENARNIATVRLQTPAHRLISAVYNWSSAVKDEIWVFQSGYWRKDESLHAAISQASWENLTLSADLLNGLRRDTRTFFSSAKVYKTLGVTWKRGLLMMGPPGNGKTESIKVLFKE